MSACPTSWPIKSYIVSYKSGKFKFTNFEKFSIFIQLNELLFIKLRNKFQLYRNFFNPFLKTSFFNLILKKINNYQLIKLFHFVH